MGCGHSSTFKMAHGMDIDSFGLELQGSPFGGSGPEDYVFPYSDEEFLGEFRASEDDGALLSHDSLQGEGQAYVVSVPDPPVCGTYRHSKFAYSVPARPVLRLPIG